MGQFLVANRYSSLSSRVTLALTLVTLAFLGACDKRVGPPAPIRGESAVPSDMLIETQEIQQEPLLSGPLPQAQADKIAVLLPLSGAHASVGQSLQKATEMSLFDYEEAPLNLSIYDTKSTSQGAYEAAQKATGEGASLILGPVFSESVQKIAPLARRQGIQIISFSNNKNVAGAGVFIFGLSPEDQMREILLYAANQGKTTIAILLPRDAYGRLIEQEIQKLRLQLPQVKFDIVSYSLGGDQLQKDLNPLKTLNFDALFIPEGGQTLDRIISAILYAEIPLTSVQLLGTNQWEEEGIYKNHTLTGAWIAGLDPQDVNSFKDKYRKNYQEEPEALAILGYDIIRMLGALKRHKPEAPFSFDALTQPRGFQGTAGIFRLRQEGITERKLAISEVTPQGLRVLQAPVSHF